MQARILYANSRNETQRVVRCKIPAKGAARRLLRIARFGGNVEICVRHKGMHTMTLQTGAWPHGSDVITLSDFRGNGPSCAYMIRSGQTFRTCDQS